MKFLIAPDSFKESMSAIQASEAIARGIHNRLPDAETLLLPLADGGEGTLDVLVTALSGERQTHLVTGPLFDPVQAAAGILHGDTGIIEMAEAAGLHLVPASQRNPELTTTQGVGDLIIRLLDQGIRRFLIALGGSATNDGGLGMLIALGAKAFDSEGRELPGCGRCLTQIAKLDIQELDSRLSESEFLLACDVNNPLTGPHGASAIFGPQKGASAAQVQALDEGMRNWASILEACFGRSIDEIPGSGAAGGLAAAFLAAFNASLKPGIEQVLDSVHFDDFCQGVDWVITGEGSLDGQSLSGKTPVGVARRAKQYDLPVVAFAGKLGEGYEALYAEGIDLALSITPEGMPLAQALAEAESNICHAAETLTELLYSRSTGSAES